MSLSKRKKTRKQSSTRKQRLSLGKFHATDYSTTELKSIAAGGSPEAYVHSVESSVVPPAHRTMARKELISRLGLGEMKEFKGKSTLTESQVRKMGKLLNNGKIRPFELREGGYALTREQQDKGIGFLRRHFSTKSHKEGSYRERKALGWDDKKNDWKPKKQTRIKLMQFYGNPQWSGGKVVRDDFFPLYAVDGNDSSFDYWYGGGKLHLTG